MGQIASTILEQLGGYKFITMTGAKNLLDHGDALSFKMPSRFANKGINYVKITLDPRDTYIIFFGKIAKYEMKEIATWTDVYADGLQGAFSRETGLNTHL